MEICDRSISTIIAMLLSGDVETERHACCSVANLVELAELRETVGRARISPARRPSSVRGHEHEGRSESSDS